MAFAAVFGKILQVVGGVAQGYAQYSDAMGRAQKMEFDSKIARRNAELARQDQMLAAEAGMQERANIAKEAHTERGEARVSYAGGNVAVDEGTPLEFDIAQAEQAAREREASKDQQAVNIARLETERLGLLAEARMLKKGAKRSRHSARLGMVGSTLQSVGGAMSSGR